VPRTRRDIEREDKVAEILEAAEGQLRDGGYDGLSLAGIARELGIAQNSIYWYFPSRDHLFVAALQRMFGKIVAHKPPAHRGLLNQVLWFVDQLHELYPLRAAMREQARRSDVVAEFERQLDGMLRTMLANAMRPHVPAKDLSSAVDAFNATVQGTYAREMKPAERRRLLRFSFERLFGQL
jgi:AcrR family transcriptional regulator